MVDSRAMVLLKLQYYSRSVDFYQFSSKMFEFLGATIA